MQVGEEFALSQPPEDAISRVRFAPNTGLLAASSWDTVRISLSTNGLALCLQRTSPFSTLFPRYNWYNYPFEQVIPL